MREFELNQNELESKRESAAIRAAAGEGLRLAERLRSGKEVDDEALAVLFLDEGVATQDLLDLASDLRETRCSGEVRGGVSAVSTSSQDTPGAPASRGAEDDQGGPQIETFSPLYISNHCDAECVMCGMRSANRDLERSTADAPAVGEQLDILYERGLRGVAILTGEYRHGALRREMLARTADATKAALDRGFTHVLINVGSIDESEYDDLLSGVPRSEDGTLARHVTMCTFQEAYDPQTYTKFMGRSPENPRSNYERRLSNFDRAADAGMRSANPGLLLGLNRDVAFEMLGLLAHVRHLQARGMQVYISLPRLRKASGAEHRAGVSDDHLARLVALLSAGVPDAKVVISTRERPEIQHRLLPVIGVLTAGSPGVAPYSSADAEFDLEASQFEVADQRPLEVILGECIEAGAVIDGYEPSGAYAVSGFSSSSRGA